MLTTNKIIDYTIIFSGGLILILLIVICYLVNKKKKEYYRKHEVVLQDIKNKISQMVPYFDKTEREKLSKLKLQPDIKSYTVNKHSMHLCLEDNGKYYDDNILIYVTLHELAHIFCDEIGHTLEYRKIFDRLLNIASSIGIYDKSISLPKEYCGVKI
jgi:hypothetical protein